MGTTTEQATTKPQPTTPPPAAREPTAAPPEKATTRKKIIFVIIGIVAVAAIFWGVKTFIYSRGHETTDNAQVDGQIVPVVAKVGGYVTEVHVAENAHVEGHHHTERLGCEVLL